jgi:hypothetical protein
VLETTLAGGFVKTIDMPFCRTALNGCGGFSDLVFRSRHRRIAALPHRPGVDNDGRLYQVKLVDVP